jgi:hypothetical protein
MERSWFVLQHVAWEGAGLIAVEAKARGLRLDVRRLDRGDSIPDPDRVNGLVVMVAQWAPMKQRSMPFWPRNAG